MWWRAWDRALDAMNSIANDGDLCIFILTKNRLHFMTIETVHM